MQEYNPVRAFLPEHFWNRRTRYYTHAVDFNLMAASAVAQSESFTEDVGSDFLCLALSQIITTDAAGGTEQTLPQHLVQVSSDSGGTFWGTGFQHAGNLFGRLVVDGPGVFVLPFGQLVQGGSTVSVRVNNLEAVARRVFMTFHGVKIYRDSVQY